MVDRGSFETQEIRFEDDTSVYIKSRIESKKLDDSFYPDAW